MTTLANEIDFDGDPEKAIEQIVRWIDDGGDVTSTEVFVTGLGLTQIDGSTTDWTNRALRARAEAYARAGRRAPVDNVPAR